jgi:hypothetical protein
LDVGRWALGVERLAPRSGLALLDACPDSYRACGGLNVQRPTPNVQRRERDKILIEHFSRKRVESCPEILPPPNAKNTLLPTSPSLLFVRPLGGEKPPVNQHPFSR